MRVLLLLVVLLTLINFCVAVPVIYTLCNKGTPLINITKVDANEWPPKKGTDLNVTIDGVLSKEVDKGQYTEQIKISGFPLPPSTGNIGEIKPLPWLKGEIDFELSTPIASSTPSCSYNVHISAADQDKAEIFCVDMAFKLMISTRGGVRKMDMQKESKILTPFNPTQRSHLRTGHREN